MKSSRLARLLAIAARLHARAAAGEVALGAVAAELALLRSSGYVIDARPIRDRGAGGPLRNVFDTYAVYRDAAGAPALQRGRLDVGPFGSAPRVPPAEAALAARCGAALDAWRLRWCRLHAFERVVSAELAAFAPDANVVRIEPRGETWCRDAGVWRRAAVATVRV